MMLDFLWERFLVEIGGADCFLWRFQGQVDDSVCGDYSRGGVDPGPVYFGVQGDTARGQVPGGPRPDFGAAGTAGVLSVQSARGCWRFGKSVNLLFCRFSNWKFDKMWENSRGLNFGY